MRKHNLGDFALRTKVQVGDQTLASYSYADVTNLLTALAYGNGDKVQYTYDSKGRLLTQTYEDGDKVTYSYDNNGALATVTDSATGIKTTYYYDLTDRMVKYVESSTNYSHTVGYEYDKINNLTTQVETINGVDRSTSYTYDKDNRVTSKQTGNTKITYDYDNFGRISTQTTYNGEDVVLTETFTYNPGSSQIATYTTTTGGVTQTYTYTYDDNGNITSINDGTSTTSYVYDSANQLIREDNLTTGYITTWTYDNAGNIIKRENGEYIADGEITVNTTNNYTYGNTNWGDLLTAYNGEPITYDTIGNPVLIGEDSTPQQITLTWQHGRQLASLSNDTGAWNYTYNADGLRTKRTDGTTTYNYVYNGSQLTGMTVDGHTLYFSYDAAGTPMSVNYDGTEYFYTSNIQGDVTGIVDAAGQSVATYSYDAWGNPPNSSGFAYNPVSTYNPLRYRGYVYDRETGHYYLQSRYYHPRIGRFINADGLTSTGQGFVGNNMFAYCGNDPVNMADHSGNKPGDLFDTMDEAAEDFAMIYAPLGYTNSVEYGSFIYSKTVLETRYLTVPIFCLSFKRLPNGKLYLGISVAGYKRVAYKVKVTKYSYFEPNIGSEDKVTIPYNWFGVLNQVAIIHTHIWIQDHRNEFFSPKDLDDGLCYLATPAGTLRKYDPNNITRTADGASVVCWDIPKDPEWEAQR